jgi:ATP-binding cassette, subfamily A (ABC1), member 3
MDFCSQLRLTLGRNWVSLCAFVFLFNSTDLYKIYIDSRVCHKCRSFYLTKHTLSPSFPFLSSPSPSSPLLLQLIKKRRRKDTLMELLFPMLFFFILLSLKQAQSPFTEAPESDQPIESAGDLSSFLQYQGLLLVAPIVGTPGTGFTTHTVLDQLRASVDSQYRNRIVGVESANAVETFWASESGQNATFGAVVFTNAATGGVLPDAIQYQIRVNGSDVPGTDANFLGFDWQDNDIADDYRTGGFSALQAAVDQIIVTARKGATFSLSLQYATLPIRAYFIDPFHQLLINIGGLYFVIGFLPVVVRLLSILVLEKEKRTREGMKMMGLRASVFAASWYIVYSIAMLIPALILSVFAVVFKFYEHTGIVPIFVLVYLYVQSLIAAAFLFQSFFDKAKTAGQFGGLVVFILYLPSYLVKDDSSSGLIAALCTSSPVAFGQGMRAIADAEQAEMGIGSNGNWTGGPDTPYAYTSALISLIIDIVLYVCLAYYLDQVVPGEYGTPKRWNFLCTSEFWYPASRTHRFPLRGRSHSGNPYEQVSTNDDDTSADSKSAASNDAVLLDPESYEAVDKDMEARARVNILELTKVYDPVSCRARRGKEAQPVRALDGVNLTMYEGQIFALLGHNGAGKSTLISILTGLYTASSGAVSMYGEDIHDNMDRVRQFIGVCPQHDILFDELTVREHLVFYGQLKGVSKAQVEDAAREKIDELGLGEKADALSKTLSGGQKRKLSLAIALIGDSKVIFLDEPSSGVDPLSRRDMWQVLQRYKKDRVIILTTHFMDEADLLGDRIAILSKGRVRCVGSSWFLKRRFGIGYRLDIERDLASTTEDQQSDLRKFVVDSVPGSRQLEVNAAGISFSLPLQGVDSFADMFRVFENDGQDRFRVANYGVSLTSLEEVFLNLAEQEEALEAGAAEEHTLMLVDPATNTLAAAANTPANLATGSDSDDSKQLAPPSSSSSLSTFSDQDVTIPVRGVGNSKSYGSAPHSAPKRYIPTAARQASAIAHKRFLLSKRDMRSLFFQLVFPVLYVLIFLIVTRNVSNDSIQRPAPLTLDSSYATAFFGGTRLPWYSPVGNTSLDNFADKITVPKPIGVGTDRNGFSTYVLRESSGTQYMGFGGSASADGSGANIVVFHNNSAVHSAPVAANLFTNGVLASIDPKYSVSLTSAPFEYVKEKDSVSAAGISIAIFIGLAFSYIPITFGIQIVKEKECKAKHQQLVMGMRVPVWWGTNVLIDLLEFMVPTIVVFILFAVFGNKILLGDNFGPALLLFVSYAWSVICLTYLVSFAFDKFVTAQTVLTLMYTLGGIILFLVALTLSFTIDKDLLNHVLAPIMSIAPVFALPWGVYLLAEAQESRSHNSGSCALNPAGCSGDADSALSTGLGSMIIVLLVMGTVFFIITLLIDSGKLRQWYYAYFRHDDSTSYAAVASANAGALRASESRGPNSDSWLGYDDRKQANAGGPAGVSNPNPNSWLGFDNRNAEEDDVAAERARVDGIIARGEPKPNITVQNMRKVFPASTSETVPKVAVERFTLGIPHGECFGLLGPNGAGKTSLLNIMTGDLPATSGDAWLARHSIHTEMQQVYATLGFCPQFDGLLDLLTGREHLMMYGRIKGIPEPVLPGIVERYMKLLHLAPHADKLSHKYSGGNKRKLSLAVALMGSPEILLLDEPSTGMDPFARRGMWEVLRQEMADRSVILTTHSMTEADQLSTRIGIMANGTLRCVGSSQHLKSKYGGSYVAEIRTHADHKCIAELKQWITSTFPGSTILEDFGGSVRCRIPEAKLSVMFDLLQSNRDQLNIIDYSMSQTTLEMIFLQFAKAQEQVHSD